MMDFEEFKRRYQKVPVEEYPNRVVETMAEPMVSVHVSTYQHADFIRDCMEGVLMQETDFPVEIIIGEDESDDGTREICKEYAEQYPEQIRLFLHRRENNIAIHGRPTGKFQSVYSHFMARGKYIAICEGDDYWTDPNKLQKQVGFLEGNEEYVLAYHSFIVKHEGNSPDDTADLLQQARHENKVKESLRPLTILYKNVIDVYPVQFMEVVCGDAFLYALLRRYGQFGWVKEVDPSVYRRHESNLYSSTDQSPKVQLNRKMDSFRTRVKILEAFRKETIESRIKNKVQKEAIGWFYSVLRSPQSEEKPWKKTKNIYYCLRELYRKKALTKACIYVIRKEVSRSLPERLKKKLKLLIS